MVLLGWDQCGLGPGGLGAAFLEGVGERFGGNDFGADVEFVSGEGVGRGIVAGAVEYLADFIAVAAGDAWRSPLRWCQSGTIIALRFDNDQGRLKVCDT